MRDMKKIEATARRLAERIEKSNPAFTAAVTDGFCRWEITVHDGEHEIALVSVTQKHSWDQVNLRLTHAGIEPAAYGYKRKHWQRDPYNCYNWGGRNYKVLDSVVNAIDKFRSLIPTDHKRIEIEAYDKYSKANRAVANAKQRLLNSFTYEQAKFLIALGVENSSGETKEALLDKSKRIVEISMMQRVSDKAYDEYQSLEEA